MDAAERIDSSVVWSMRAAIGESEGSEVLFLCDLDGDMRVISSRVVARGVPDMVAAPMEQLHRGQVVIHNHPSGSLQPSRADVSVAAELADSGVGSYVVDNDVTELLVVVEPAEPHRLEPLDADELAATIDDGGALSDLFHDFEPRQSQVDMLRLVANGFNEDRIVAVEAGTGVGKSFAYLIPALAWADRNDERVVVSTATINLQQQLVEKDIPTVQRLLGVDVPVMLVKGRGNYLCRKRLGEAFDEESLFAEDAESPTHPRTTSPPPTLTTTSTLPTPTSTRFATGRARATPAAAASCLSPCPTSSGAASIPTPTRAPSSRAGCATTASSCGRGAGRRRRRCSSRTTTCCSSISRLRVRGIGFETRAVLPPFQRLVFDEAHSIENSATSLFSESFSRYSVRKHSRRLRHSGAAGSTGCSRRYDVEVRTLRPWFARSTSFARSTRRPRRSTAR